MSDPTNAPKNSQGEESPSGGSSGVRAAVDVESADAVRAASAPRPAFDPALEVDFAERPPCPRCGGPMNVSLAFVCGRGFASSYELPPYCADDKCRRVGQQARDEAALERAIALGVIDP